MNKLTKVVSLIFSAPIVFSAIAHAEPVTIRPLPQTAPGAARYDMATQVRLNDRDIVTTVLINALEAVEMDAVKDLESAAIARNAVDKAP